MAQTNQPELLTTASGKTLVAGASARTTVIHNSQWIDFYACTQCGGLIATPAMVDMHYLAVHPLYVGPP